MQCESVLRSILQHVKGVQVYVSVVWHATGKHVDGYTLLRQLYQDKGVRFEERSSKASFAKDVLPRLSSLRNLYHWVKFPQVRKMDNFQPLVERLIVDVDADLVSFNTDDNIYYRDEELPERIFSEIFSDPLGTSYRVYVGGNQNDCPKLEIRDGMMVWNYYDPKLYRHWAYPFSVDGTFYQRDALVYFLKRLLYHNPVTLESFGVGLARSRRWFGKGLSPCISSMLAVPINKVDMMVSSNRHGDVSVDRLNDLFLNGYHLEYHLPDPVCVSGFIPDFVWACRGNEKVKIPVKFGVSNAYCFDYNSNL